MAEEYLRIEVHDEFAKRMLSENARLEDENIRQNKRLQAIEDENKQIQSLALSVQDLAASVKSIAKESERLGNQINDSINKIDDSIDKIDGRVTKIEGQDGEKWKTTVNQIISTVVGLFVGYIFSRFGM